MRNWSVNIWKSFNVFLQFIEIRIVRTEQVYSNMPSLFDFDDDSKFTRQIILWINESMNGLRIEHSFSLQTDGKRWARLFVVMNFLEAREIESLRLQPAEGVSGVGTTKPIVSFSTRGDKTFGESSALEAWGNGFYDVGIRAYTLVAIFSLMILLVIELHWSEEWMK